LYLFNVRRGITQRRSSSDFNRVVSLRIAITQIRDLECIIDSYETRLHRVYSDSSHLATPFLFPRINTTDLSNEATPMSARGAQMPYAEHPAKFIHRIAMPQGRQLECRHESTNPFNI